MNGAIPNYAAEKYAAQTDERAYRGDTKAQFAPKPICDVDLVHEVLSFANTMTTRIAALADSACGSVPTPGLSGGVEVSQDGVFPRLVSSATYTRSRLTDAMEALDRIERSLGVTR